MKTKKISFSRILSAILLLLLAATVSAEEFVIEDIRVHGLQRLTPGTVFNYMPLEVGDTYTDELSVRAVRALFKTGFFDDVKIERDGSILVVILKERPTIGSIEITGNKDIKTEDLLKGLKEVGFAEGRVFEQSQLEGLERELRRQYFSAGKYGVKVKSTVTPLGNNRVGVAIEVAEGKAARIKQINIVGNQAFKEKHLLKQFELTGPTLFSFFTKTNQYSKQKLSGDLETLRSLYLDHGYINFNIDSTQVSITPDKNDIYITINITEGSQYTVTGVKLAGDMILPPEEFFDLITVTQGSLFSRKDVTDSSTNISDRLGNEGYAFANVNSIPEINEEEKTVALTFFIDPGKRVYVRRVNFKGNTKTRDEVLRREMRQQEGAWVATPQVERGKVRLQRLGYFKEVNVETPAVAGAADLVDVEYSVEEQAFGNFMIGMGYSQVQGLTFQTSITQENFLGSGKRIQFAFNNSQINRRFAVGYLNPYYTIDGISRGFSANYQETQAYDANITAFENRVMGVGVNFGIPISEYHSVFTALNYENTKISPDGFYAQEVQKFIDREGSKYDVLRLTTSFAYDTRNKAIFPDAGLLNRITGEVALPSFGNALEFYKISYQGQWFRKLPWDFVLALKGDVGYADSFGSTEELPFFENFYAGGPRTVRGYEENTLGPRDSFNRPLGGIMKIVAGTELIVPIPFLKDLDNVRFAGFVDAGNVYGANETIDLGLLRYSVGFGGIWMSPFGIVSVSIAKPFADKPGDKIQTFQFNFGSTF